MLNLSTKFARLLAGELCLYSLLFCAVFTVVVIDFASISCISTALTKENFYFHVLSLDILLSNFWRFLKVILGQKLP